MITPKTQQELATGNGSSISGKNAEISSATRECINGIIEDAFDKPTTNSKLNAIITEAGIAICLKGE